MNAAPDRRCEKCRGPRRWLTRWLRDGLWVGLCCRGLHVSLRELETKRRQLELFGQGGKK